MTVVNDFKKPKINKKRVRFRLFILAVIEITCANIYLVISGYTGSFDWTIERLTTTVEGFVIQVIQLISFIAGVIITVYVIMYLLLIAKGSD